MTLRRKNPTRACKSSSKGPASYNANTVDSDESDFEGPPNKRHYRQEKKNIPESDQEDSSFSVHLSDEDLLDSERYPEPEPEPEPQDDAYPVPLPKQSMGKKSSSKPSKPKKQGQPNKKTRQATETLGSPRDLTSEQSSALDRIFSRFDPHENGRLGLSDLLRVADDHGVILSNDEARDMLRFWDTSGTNTISRESFTDLALECKFVAARVGTK